MNHNPIGGLLTASFLLGALFATASVAGADDEPNDWCLSGPASVQLPPPPIVRAGFVYVTFPDSTGQPDPSLPSVIDDIRANVDPARFALFLSRQSDGAHTIVPSIIRNPLDSDAMWLARHPYTVYEDLVQLESVAQFRECWDPNGRVPSAAEISLEILHLVADTYEDLALADPWANLDLVIFVNTARPWPGGVAGIGNLQICVDVGCACADPLRVLKGITTVWGSGVGRYGWNFTLAHEYGHGVLARQHTPKWPQPDDPQHAGLEKYGFGVYSLMRPSNINDQGFVSLDVTDLEALAWLPSRVPVTGNLRDVVIRDVRTGGTVYGIRAAAGDSVEVYEGGNTRRSQEFLISWHGRLQEDAELNAQGTPLYPSRGLAVWHALTSQGEWQGTLYPSSATLLDVESAYGRFADPGPLGSGGFWQVPDPKLGYDNLDRWPGRSPDESTQYPGDVSDFFNLPTRKEFSFRTNPNTFLVNRRDNADELRRLPQDVPTSLLVEVKADYGDSALVDILLAPYERILSPSSGAVYASGSEVRIAWEDGRSWGWDPNGVWGVDEVLVIDHVDILLSRDGGATWPNVIAENIPNVGEYSWTPGLQHASDQARVKVVYHNIFSSFTGEDESEGSFSILPPVPVAAYQDQSEVSGIAYPPQDVPYSAVSLNFDEGTAQDAGPDLFITMSEGQDRSYLFRKEDEAGGVPVYLDRTEQSFPFPGEVPQIGLRGASVADFDNDGDADIFGAAATVPRLYRNDPGPNGTRVYHDVADIGDMRTWIDSSWMGAWGDYDRDGWLDLFVVRAGGDGTPSGTTPDQCRLFRNLLPGSVGFGDMTPSVGLLGYQHLSAATSASWADVDDNGSLDLLLGHVPAVSGPAGRVRVYLNQDATNFVEDGLARIQREGYELGIGYANGVSWADVNQDGRLDLLLSREKAQTESNTMVFTNDGIGHFSAYDVAAGIADPEPVSGVVSFDQDLNGYVDLCWAPLGNTPVVLHSSFPNAAGVAWLSRAGAVGIAPGAAGGVVAQDTNADGDVDLYVGRPFIEGAGKLYYQNVSPQGGDEPANKWVQIRLSAPLGGNNREGIGATVTVEGNDGTGPIKQVQLVDGGSSRGGQQARTLTFGLGQTTSPVGVTIRWPDGATQVVTIQADQLNRLHVIEDDHAPEIVGGSLLAYFEPGPNGTVDFVFQWLTENSSLASQDQVQLWSQAKPAAACKLATYPNPTWLSQATPGVTITVELAPAGRYLHTLRWGRDACAATCYYYWQAVSGIGSRWSTYPLQQPWPQLVVFQCTLQ